MFDDSDPSALDPARKNEFLSGVSHRRPPAGIFNRFLELLPDETIAAVYLQAARDQLAPSEYCYRVIEESVKNILSGEDPAGMQDALRFIHTRKIAPQRRGPRPPTSTIEQRKVDYLELVYDTGSLKKACDTMKMSQSVPYIWSRNDPAFREKWNVARGFCGKPPLHE